jgi:hypothetical protein
MSEADQKNDNQITGSGVLSGYFSNVLRVSSSGAFQHSPLQSEVNPSRREHKFNQPHTHHMSTAPNEHCDENWCFR